MSARPWRPGPAARSSRAWREFLGSIPSEGFNTEAAQYLLDVMFELRRTMTDEDLGQAYALATGELR